MAFASSRHFNIENFNAVTYGTQGGDAGLMGLLLKARAAEATDKSRTAAYAPKCKEGTRTEILDDIMAWVERPTPGSVLWFSGPAGGGKTCIMREVAIRCRKAGFPTLTYFFSTRVGGRLTKEAPFVATIVYQLITAIPALKPSVLQAIANNPAIFEESLDSQMEALVIEPLQSNTSRFDSSSLTKLVIVIDGLDECGDKDERRHLLDLFHTLLHQVSMPIFLVVASRPEFDIRIAFETPQFEPITNVLLLQKYDGTVDVRHFYCDEFERIRRTHPMRASIPENWPSEDILGALMEQSSGYFIIPATIINYIDNPRRNPVELLKLAMSTSLLPTAENPLADIDSLYTLILHPPDTDLPLLRRMLHAVIAFHDIDDTDFPPSASFLDTFFQLAPGTVQSTFCDLHSVLSVPPTDSAFGSTTAITFHHKSLQDYLLSSDRSHDLYHALGDTQLDMAAVCARHIERWGRYPTAESLSEVVRYAVANWDEHVDEGLLHQADSMIIPDNILSFDPRVMWNVDFALGSPIFPGPLGHQEFHQVQCSRGPCSEFCKNLKRMEECYSRAEDFAKAVENNTLEERLVLLPRFEVETGLYDPLEEKVGEGEKGVKVYQIKGKENKSDVQDAELEMAEREGDAVKGMKGIDLTVTLAWLVKLFAFFAWVATHVNLSRPL